MTVQVGDPIKERDSQPHQNGVAVLVKCVITVEPAKLPQHPSQSFRIQLVLFNQNPRRQTLDCVVIVNRNRALRDNRPAIERFVNKVNRAAAESGPVLEGLFLRVQAGEQRQETGMNIQNASGKRFEKLAGEKTHVTSQANQIDLPGLQRRHDFAVMFSSLAAATFDHQSFNPALCCFRQPFGLGLIADDDRYLGFWNLPIAYGIGQRDHVRTPA